MVVGIVAAKENSKRFPGKNNYIVDGKPMFWHSIKPLLDSSMVDDVFVVTDSIKIKEYCEKQKDVNVIWRPKNACRDEDKLISILRFAYYSLDKEYDHMISIMANCPGHTSLDVNKSLTLVKEKNLREVRSFNDEGEESGILVFSKEILTNNFDVSYYIGSINSNVNEIHYKEEI